MELQNNFNIITRILKQSWDYNTFVEKILSFISKGLSFISKGSNKSIFHISGDTTILY